MIYQIHLEQDHAWPRLIWHPTCSSWSIPVCDEGEGLCIGVSKSEVYSIHRVEGGEHTHHNAIYIQLPSFVVVLIQGSFTNCESSTDGKGKPGWRSRRYGEGLVDKIYGQDDGGQVGDTTREKQHHIFENLDKVVWARGKKWETVTHLQNILKLGSDIPLSGQQFILAKVKITDGSHCINGDAVFNGKLEHVICAVPTSWYIPGHHAFRKGMHGKCLVPHWEEPGRWILERKCKFPQLHSQHWSA